MVTSQIEQPLAGHPVGEGKKRRLSRRAAWMIGAGGLAVLLAGGGFATSLVMNQMKADKYSALVAEVNELHTQTAEFNEIGIHSVTLLELRTGSAVRMVERLEAIAQAPATVLDEKVAAELRADAKAISIVVEDLSSGGLLADMPLLKTLQVSEDGVAPDWIAVSVYDLRERSGQKPALVVFEAGDLTDENMRVVEKARDEAAQAHGSSQEDLEIVEVALAGLDSVIADALPTLETVLAGSEGQAEQLLADYSQASNSREALPQSVKQAAAVQNADEYQVDVKTGNIIVPAEKTDAEIVEGRDAVRSIAYSHVVKEYVDTATNLISEHDQAVAAAAAAEAEAVEAAAAAEAAAAGGGGYYSPNSGTWTPSGGGGYAPPAGGGGYVPPSGGGGGHVPPAGGSGGGGYNPDYQPPGQQCLAQPPNTYWGGSTANGCPVWVPNGSGGVDEW